MKTTQTSKWLRTIKAVAAGTVIGGLGMVGTVSLAIAVGSVAGMPVACGIIVLGWTLSVIAGGVAACE